ncbi:class I SAM-dependent methyltransferase [Bombiscardovia coagulans]|uniref:Methyltransferase domain-containing protein n=1 Tax=Bombiscardovia coagulans TaxID=686666 RepID=A0A261EVJ6_9BIFI|nr:class I SAM-dependent methyltransferase [Bombiscardovia coagulans]OZG50855.1 Methyltransferase domain-containing protein [Bombiscardovia coagulans]
MPANRFEVVNLPGGKQMPLNEKAKLPSSGIDFVNAIKPRLELLPPGRVLDIGAGYYGIIGSAFAQLGWEVTLLEKNPDACEHLQQSFPYKCRVLNEDIRTTTIPDSYFDCIVSNPAQMPAQSDDEQWDHDVAGMSGFDMMEYVIHSAHQALTEDGILLILVFGFHLTAVKECAQEQGLILKNQYRMLKRCSANGHILSSLKRLRQLYLAFNWDDVSDKHVLPTSIVELSRGERQNA